MLLALMYMTRGTEQIWDLVKPNRDKPESEPYNREGAKDAKEIFNSWYLTIGSLALLRDLSALAVNFLSILRRI
jgi:hypothetical protein